MKKVTLFFIIMLFSSNVFPQVSDSTKNFFLNVESGLMFSPNSGFHTIGTTGQDDNNFSINFHEFSVGFRPDSKNEFLISYGEGEFQHSFYPYSIITGYDYREIKRQYILSNYFLLGYKHNFGNSYYFGLQAGLLDPDQDFLTSAFIGKRVKITQELDLNLKINYMLLVSDISNGSNKTANAIGVKMGLGYNF